MSDRGRGCYPSVPRGKVAPPFTGPPEPPAPWGGGPSSRCAGVPSGPGPQGCPCIPARTMPRVPQSLGGVTPDLRSPSPSAGPWGNALLLDALRRSRTRPRRSPGRASSQLRASGPDPCAAQRGFTPTAPRIRFKPLTLGRFQEASREGGEVLLPRRRRLPTPPQTAPEAFPSWVKSDCRMQEDGADVKDYFLINIRTLPSSKSVLIGRD